jgi:hypothetical protein
MRNRLSARTLSKDYFYIFDHIEYIITSIFLRWLPVICLTVEMLAFFSYGMNFAKKSTVRYIHILLTIS